MNVFEYANQVLEPKFEIDQELKQALESMPLDSNCGNDCKDAIDSGAKFLVHVRNAYGDSWNVREVMDTILETCTVFICG